MAIRMTGMISGLDTDSIIQSLVDAQKTKNKKTTDKKTKLEWKQEKWKALNQKLLDLTYKQIDNMKMQKNYMTKKVTASDETKVSAKADINTPEGSHQITVSQLASSQYVTSGQITTDGFGTGTKLTDIGFTAGQSVINITNGSKSVQLDVSDKTTVKDFISSCSSAGLNASYDAAQKRFFISSKESGKDNAFTITSGSYTSEGVAAKDAITGLINMDASGNTAAVSAALLALGKGGDTSKTEEALKDLAVSKVDAEATNKANNFYFQVAKKDITLDAETIQKIEEDNAGIEDEAERNAAIQAQKEEKIYELTSKKLATEEYQTKIKDALANGIDEAMVESELGADAALYADAYTFEDKTTRTVQAQSAMEAAVSNYKALGSTSTTPAGSADSALKNLGLGEITNTSSDLSASATGSFTLVAAKNSIIKYNGVEMENSSNSISVNGLSVELKGVTDSPITINVSQDTDSTYNMIKDFVNTYNSILKEMNDLYYADSAKGYAPLSDDEKEAMTDDEVEKWETKIKDSILRRDDTIGGIINAMKNALQTSITVDGKKYSLSSFGVGTSSDYTEKGLLHIDGDDDDTAVKGKTNKLKNALVSDPDLVMQVFTGVAKELASTMSDKMKKTTLSSAQKFYNDKDIQNQIDKLTKQISKESSALTDLEDKYYDQFGAMETALAKLQSSQNALSGLLGK